jgi:hypothetical protein
MVYNFTKVGYKIPLLYRGIGSLSSTMTRAGEWGRLPVRPKDRLEGLSRVTLLELGAAGLIKIATLRKPGSRRGIKLVHIPSLLAYIESCVQQPDGTKVK